MRIINDRFKHQPAWAAVTGIFIGLGWLRAATAKSIDSSWWNGSALQQFLVEQDGTTLGWYRPFIELVVAPNLLIFSAVVFVMQIVVAACLLSGRHRSIGLAVGIGLNLHFVAAGAVNPSAFYLLAQGALVLWLIERRQSVPSVDSLLLAAGSGLTVVGFHLPFIRTLAPATVIDDPAIMMATVGGLTSLACLLMAERVDALQRSEAMAGL